MAELINLLPEKIKKLRKRERYKRISLVIIILFVCLLLGASNYMEELSAQYQKKLARLKKRITDLKATKAVLGAQLQRKNQKEEKLNLINTLDNDLNYSWLIKDLQLIIPKQVYLEELIIKQNNQLLAAGNTVTNQFLLKTAERLEKYPYFEGVRIESSQEVKGRIYFTIQGQVRENL